MPGKAAEVIVTELQQAILQAYSKSRSVCVSLAQCSTIILLAFDGLNNEAIEALVGLQHDAVGRWRRRWRDRWERLIDIECTQPRYVLEAAVSKLLSDLHRTGRRPRVTDQQQVAIFKTACEDPKKTSDRSRDGVEANFVCI